LKKDRIPGSAVERILMLQTMNGCIKYKSCPRLWFAGLVRLSVLCLAFTVTSGCMKVTTDQYVHEPTEKIRLGQYNSAYLADASSAFPAVLEGIIIVPEFSRRVSNAANLRGSLFVVARSNHSLLISSVSMSSPDVDEIHVVNPNTEFQLSHIKQSNLWQRTIPLSIPVGSFADAQTIKVVVTWQDTSTEIQTRTVLRLERERRSRYVFPT